VLNFFFVGLHKGSELKFGLGYIDAFSDFLYVLCTLYELRSFSFVPYPLHFLSEYI
jgi:hypothetical protein